jgi:hypothetical protein
MKKVTPHTQAGKDGKVIVCPKCKKEARVYHFEWSALQCQHCGQASDKTSWLRPVNWKLTRTVCTYCKKGISLVKISDHWKRCPVKNGGDA